MNKSSELREEIIKAPAYTVEEAICPGCLQRVKMKEVDENNGKCTKCQTEIRRKND